MMALPTRPSVRRGHSFGGAAGDKLPFPRLIEQQLRSREIVALLRQCGSGIHVPTHHRSDHLCRRLILQTVQLSIDAVERQ